MKLVKNSVLVIMLLLAGINAQSSQTFKNNALQTSDYNYMVLYVETIDSKSIDGFINEMLVLTDKVIDIRYDYTTHEFTILFTDLLRNDTIYQILLKYFDDFDEVDGKYPIN